MDIKSHTSHPWREKITAVHCRIHHIVGYTEILFVYCQQRKTNNSAFSFIPGGNPILLNDMKDHFEVLCKVGLVNVYRYYFHNNIARNKIGH